MSKIEKSNLTHRIAQFFFIWLLAFLLLIVALWVAPAPTASTGQLHPEFKTMLKSGDSVASSATVKWLAYLFGIGIIGIFGCSMFFGSRKKNKNSQTKMRRVLFAGFLLYILIYTLLVFSHWNYHDYPSNNYFLGYPIPTAWMLYGMWPAPFFITIFIILKFDDWILTSDEIDDFKKLVLGKSDK